MGEIREDHFLHFIGGVSRTSRHIHMIRWYIEHAEKDQYRCRQHCQYEKQADPYFFYSSFSGLSRHIPLPVPSVTVTDPYICGIPRAHLPSDTGCSSLHSRTADRRIHRLRSLLLRHPEYFSDNCQASASSRTYCLNMSPRCS